MKFTLRSLLILILGISIWLGGLANAVHRQRTAVTALLSLDIAVHYDYEREVLTRNDLTFPKSHNARRYHPLGFTDRIAVPSAPHWLRRLTGDDYFQTVTAVSIYDNFPTDLWADGYPTFIDSALPHLRRLPHLSEIYLHQPRDHAESQIFAEVKELLSRELPRAKVTEIAFVTIR